MRHKTRIIGGAAAALALSGAVVAAFDGGSALRNDRVASTTAAPGGLDSGLRSARVDDLAAGAGSSAQAAAPALATGDTKDSVVATGPRVVKTATLNLSVTKASAVQSAAAKANSIAEAHGGYVASTQSDSGDNASAQLVVRVPVAAYDATLREMRGLGKVSSETLGGQDVTDQLVDLDARIRSLRAQESALNALMTRANTVGETLQVAQAVADVRTRVEQLAAQQAQLSNQADLATITLRVAGPNAPVPGDDSPQPVLVRAFERATGGALDVVGGALIVFGYALPAALLGAAGYAVWRFVSRRRVAVA